MTVEEETRALWHWIIRTRRSLPSTGVDHWEYSARESRLELVLQMGFEDEVDGNNK